MFTITPASQWLLDRAATVPISVATVLPSFVEPRAQWNIPSPDWDDRSLFQNLSRLAEVGYISFLRRRLSTDQEVEETGPRFQGKTIIDDYLRHTPLAYKLTPEGAAAWEVVAVPDWRLSYACEFEETQADCNYDGQLHMTAGSEETLVLASFYEVCNQNLVPIPCVTSRSRIEAWKPNYWKTLRSGYRMTFAVCELPETSLRLALTPKVERHAAAALKSLSRWYQRAHDPTWA